MLISLADMATAASPRFLVSPAATDRKFYTGMAMAMMFTALFGFSRTYFLGLISGHPTTITGRVPNATVHLHALLFMSWLVLFIVQTSLIATHRVKVHRKLGYFGVVYGGFAQNGYLSLIGFHTPGNAAGLLRSSTRYANEIPVAASESRTLSVRSASAERFSDSQAEG